jgi:hypothetical protein
MHRVQLPTPSPAMLQIAKSPASDNMVFGYQVTSRGIEQDMSIIVPEAVQQSVLDASIANEIDTS